LGKSKEGDQTHRTVPVPYQPNTHPPWRFGLVDAPKERKAKRGLSEGIIVEAIGRVC